MSSNNFILQVDELCSGYGQSQVLFDVTLNCQKQGAVAILGRNGAGKSTILDALCFGLFGKPFRQISKGQLINTINAGGTIVEIEFESLY